MSNSRKKKVLDTPSLFFQNDSKEKIKELIKRRRGQMLVHSCIYYELNTNIVSDDTWQSWADELQKLQEDNPDCIQLNYFDREFHDWNGTTGSHLPHRDPNVYALALRLIRIHERKQNENT